MSLDKLREDVDRGAMTFHYDTSGLWDGESALPIPGSLAIRCMRTNTLYQFEPGQLPEFAAFIRARPEITFIHWSASTDVFGFIPIAKYAREWGMESAIPERMNDLHGVLYDVYGGKFAKLPSRLRDIVALNGIRAGSRLKSTEELRAAWVIQEVPTTWPDGAPNMAHVSAVVECLHWLTTFALDGTLKTRAKAVSPKAKAVAKPGRPATNQELTRFALANKGKMAYKEIAAAWNAKHPDQKTTDSKVRGAISNYRRRAK